MTFPPSPRRRLLMCKYLHRDLYMFFFLEEIRVWGHDGGFTRLLARVKNSSARCDSGACWNAVAGDVQNVKLVDNFPPWASFVPP